MADGRRSVELALRERALGAALHELYGADHAVLDDQRQGGPALLREVLVDLVHLRREPRVAQRAHDRRPFGLDDLTRHGGVRQRQVLADPALVHVAAGDPHQGAQPVALDHRDLALGHADAVAEPLGGGDQRVAQVEAAGQLEGRFAHERHPAHALVELAVEARVGHGLAGDLRQADDDVGTRERPLLPVADIDEADQLAPRQQGDRHDRLVAPSARVLAVAFEHVRVVQDVQPDHGPSRGRGFDEGAGLVSRVASAHGLVADAAAQRDEDLDVVAGQAVHVAEVGLGDGDDALRHGAEHRVDVQRGAELEPRVDEQTQVAVAALQTLHEHGFLEGAGQQPSDVADEIEHAGVVAHLGVEDVDQPDGAALDDERQRHHAAVAPAAVGRHLLFRQAGGLEVADHHRLVGRQRRDGRLVDRQVAFAAHLLRVPAAAVDAREALQASAFDPPDVAVLGLQDGPQAAGDDARQLLQALRLAELVAELHELPQRRVALPQAAHQMRVLERVGDGARGAREKAAHLVVVALHGVEDVDHADDLVPGDERQRDHAVEAVSAPVFSLVVGDARIVQGGEDQHLTVREGARGRREHGEIQSLAAHGLVRALAVHAGEAAQVAFFQPPDVAVVRAADLAEPARGCASDLLRRAGARQAAGELDELVLQSAAGLDLVQQHGVLEQARDQLHHPGQVLDLELPVALGVVVELGQPDDGPPGDQGHGERAGVAPLAIALDLLGRQPWVRQAVDDERRVVDERPLEGRILGRVEDLVVPGAVHAFAGEVEEQADDAAADAVEVDTVGVHGRHQAQRETLGERVQLGRLRDLLRKIHEVADGLVAMLQRAIGRVQVDGVGADARETGDHRDLRPEVARSRVAHLHGADEDAAHRHRRPHERPAAAALQGAARALSLAATVRGEGGRRQGVGCAALRQPVVQRPRIADAAFVELAAVDRDGEPQPFALTHEDVAARRVGQLAEAPRDVLGHVARRICEERRQVEARLHDGAQVLGLTAQFGEVAGVRRGSRDLFFRQKREDVFGEVAAMAARAAVGGDAPRVGPAPHRVDAHAEQARHVGDAQPGGVCSLSDAVHDSTSRNRHFRAITLLKLPQSRTS